MPTSIPRTLLSEFALANPTYAGAQIAVYEVDANLARTATLAPLYADQAGSTLLANPQLLNSQGQNAAPIYIDRPVITRVTRGAETQDLGVQGVSGRWRGVWAAATLYYVGERVRDPAGPSTYLALVTHTSSGSFATDLAVPRWEQEIDAASMGAATVNAVFPSVASRKGKLLGFNATTGDAEAVDAKSVFVGSAPTGGTATAQTLALSETIAGLTNGMLVAAEIGITCGVAPQLNVASTGLKKIYVSTVRGPVQPEAGELAAGNWAIFAYDATQDSGTGGWVLQSGQRPLPEAGESLGLLLNPQQEVSQVNGASSVTVTSSFTTTIDRIGAVENCGTLTATAQQVADPFSGSAGFRRLRFGHRATVGTLQASLSAGEFLCPWRQALPGTFWRGLAWGTADARAVDVVAIVSASVAGTYAVALRNGAAARSYVSTVTLAAATPTVIVLRVPGDTTGTWPTDGTTALTLDLGAVTGTTFRASSLDAWASGNFLSHSTCTNWGGTASATFTVGYADIFPAGVLPFATSSQVTGESLQCLLNLRRSFEVERARCNFSDYMAIFMSSADAAAARAALVVPDVPGWRNLLINANPFINQRGYTSGTATGGANQYTVDLWRVVVSGQALSWTDSANVRTCTAPAGGVEQVVEGLSIYSGTHTLSWTGTATATVDGNAVANGGQVTLTGGTNAVVRFSGGTFALPQLEPGSVATPFERRPRPAEQMMCDRFYTRTLANSRTYAAISSQTYETSVYFGTVMRDTPNVTILTAGFRANLTSATAIALDSRSALHRCVATAVGDSFAQGDIIEASAEFS